MVKIIQLLIFFLILGATSTVAALNKSQKITAELSIRTLNTFIIQDTIVRIYPNPAPEYVIIELADFMQVNISIKNHEGKTLLQCYQDVPFVELGLANLPKGVYFIEVLFLKSKSKIVRKVLKK